MNTNSFAFEISSLISSASFTLAQGKSSIKLFCLSDLHADTAGCLDWLKSNCIRRDEECVHTVFICAGDVSAEVKVLREVFTHLKANYDDVCFTPGNHDLWRKGSEEQGTGGGAVAKQALASCSFSKLAEVLRCALTCQVHIGPLELIPPPSSSSGCLPPSVKVLPLFSWYHSSWDTEPNIEHPDFLLAEKLLPFDKKWSDFRMCSWSMGKEVEPLKISTIGNGSTELAEYFAKLNEPYLPLPSNALSEKNPIPIQLPAEQTPAEVKEKTVIGRQEAVVVTYSHFLPRQELCPEKKYLLEPQMSKVIGSKFLEEQIRRVQPQLHIFGHTHIPIELALEGIRYVQWPLGYAREKDSSTTEVYREGPLMVYDSSLVEEGEDKGPVTLNAAVPGFPSHTMCHHSRWSKYYRENGRTAGTCKPSTEGNAEGGEEELSPWLAAKLSDFLKAMA